MFNPANDLIKRPSFFRHRRIKTSNDIPINYFNQSMKKQQNNKKFKYQHLKSLIDKAKIAYHQQQNFQQVIQFLQEYLIYKSDDNEALYLSAISYLNLNEPFEAIHKLELISSNFSSKCYSLLLLAVAYAKVQNLPKSLQSINQCIYKFNKFQQAYSYRGKIHMKIQQFQKAEQDFNYSLKLNPESFISRVGLADCYYQQKKYQHAIQYYEESLKYLNSDNQINKNNNQKRQSEQIICKQVKKIQFYSNTTDIILKQSICYFILQQYSKVIQKLDRIQTSQRTSQSYYYQGMSYLNLSRKPEAILNLQYCIRLQTNKSLIQKSFKVLIEQYLNDYQFYQALNLLKIADNVTIKIGQIKYWKNLVEGSMLVIKAYYNQGLLKLNEIYHILKLKNNENYQENKKGQESKQNQRQIQFSHHKHSKSPNYKNQFLGSSSPQIKSKRKVFLARKSSQSIKRKSDSSNSQKKSSISLNRTRSIFKTSQDRYFLNIVPTNSYESKLKIKVKKFFSHTHNQIKKIKQEQKQKQIFNDEEALFVMPIVLKFKAYAQFFNNDFLKSLQTYEQYETYMKNLFGKQSTEIFYNKLICEALLLNETQLYKESIQKFDEAIVEYEKFYGNIPLEPVLYKIALLLQLFVRSFDQKQQQKQKGYKYLEKVLEINRKYKNELSNNYLSHYYLGIIYYLCQKYSEAQEQLQKTLKLVEQCTWKILNIKGVVQITLLNYYDAIKQFTAGLIFEQNADLYIGRSIAFLLQGSKRRQKELATNMSLPSSTIDFSKLKNTKISSSSNVKSEQVTSEIFIENSFQDLQKYIQLQTDQERVSLWVTKMLFFNQAYQEAIKALQKIDKKDQQLQEIECWLKLYQGEFQECGEIGYLIIDAFESNLLTESQQKQVLSSINESIRNSLQGLKINPNYERWLIILHLSKKQKYSDLIKYLQKIIFQTSDTTQLIQFKYNLALTYLFQDDKARALNIFQAIKKMINLVNHEILWNRIKKIINFDFDEDQCLPDLSQMIGANQNHRLSEYLPYKLLHLKGEKVKKIYVKFSIPFPDFPKPNLIININHSFILKQLDLSLQLKKIQAPWIKRNKQKIQFTENIIEAETDFLKETKQMNQDHQDDQVPQF